MSERIEYEYEKKTRGHIWATDGDEIDIFKYNPSEYHNGPQCTVCGYGFCHHCHEGPEIDCPAEQKPNKPLNPDGSSDAP